MFSILILLQVASSAAPTPAPPTPINPHSWVTAKDYPLDALKNGDAGTVEYEVTVDKRGRPGECRIITSSGHASLDAPACRIVTTRGRFRPAVGPDGKAIAGSYKGKVIWAGGKMPETWQAAILDFTDRDHPKCTEQKRGGADPLPQLSCSYILQQKALLEGLGRTFTIAVSLWATSDGNGPLYQGDPSWGPRLSYVADEQYYLGHSGYPVSCKTVAAEGGGAGVDACAGMPNARKLSDKEMKQARVTRSEFSSFGVLRQP